MAEKKLKFAFRLVHILNIPHILKKGIVRAVSINANPEYISIGDQKVIEKRSNKYITTQLKVSDLIPFYFGPRSPMLYVIQHGYNGVKRIDAEDLVYCVIRLGDVISDRLECIFSDGHILNGLSQIYDMHQLPNVDKYVKYDDVYARRWDDEDDTDLKRRKEAELLLKNDIPAKYIRGFVVYNKEAMNRLLLMGVDDKMIAVKSDYYF